jgi:hypothetical protein
MDKAMIPNLTSVKLSTKANQTTRQGEMLQSLGYVAARLVNEQFAPFSARVVDALALASQQSADAEQINFCFSAGNQLKNNGAAFARLAMDSLTKVLRREINLAEYGAKHDAGKADSQLSLVSYEEMEDSVLLGRISHSFDLKNADQLTALNIRLAFLLERNELATAQNPFRPESFLCALRDAWRAFDLNADTDGRILQFFQPELFFDLAPIFSALNEALMGRGILPGSVEAFRIKKTESHAETNKAANAAMLSQQLKQLFSPDTERADVHQFGHADYGLQAAAASNKLFGFLAQMQHQLTASNGPVVTDSAPSNNDQAKPNNVIYLPKIKQMAPQGSLSRVDENTIDLLSKVFETVFVDGGIPQEIKSLVGFLQIPVLKEALTDKEFFYQEAHPARRLIELLTQLSLGWGARKGQDDPIFEAMKRNVGRIQQESDQKHTLFADIVSELETLIKQQEAASTEALSAPISVALKREKVIHATKAAKNDVALRIGTGEVVAMVETFLENKWTSVLTIAYSVQDEKPDALKSAVKTMDDLIWSVKPKITIEQRKQFIAKLPGLLSMLNKWLNVIKWEDADRLQFFAELAECHASIVRAPLELSPERQMQIAVEAAKLAAERRLQLAEKLQPAPVVDASTDTVESLERGMWMEFSPTDGDKRKVKLAWVSPLRSLFIFSANAPQETFSLSAEEMAQHFREQWMRVLHLDGMDGKSGLVTHALSQALANVSANQPRIGASA